MARRRKKWWSINVGERGRNWVRAYCEGCRDKRSCVRDEDHTGRLYLEWHGTTLDPDTGEERTVRRRALLQGVTTASEATRRALDAAERILELEEERSSPLTLTRLLTIYTQEVTPNKGQSKQGHDRRAARVWTAFLSAQQEPERRMGRHPSTLDRVDWDRFIQWRREGRIPGWRPVRDRQVQYDLKYMIAVLGWAAGTRIDGELLLEGHPWSPEIRRAQRWEMPTERNPRRPAMTAEIRQLLIEHSGAWQFELALQLGRSTVSRNSSVRHLRWSDIDLEEGTVRWRGEHDKAGRDVVVPLLPEAVEALRRVPVRGIGEAWVFPAATDPTKPTSRHTFQSWLRRAKSTLLASIEDEEERRQMAGQLRGLGYHGEKRAGVRDPAFRALPPGLQEHVARTNYRTLKDVYDEITVEDARKAMEAARQVARGN